MSARFRVIILERMLDLSSQSYRVAYWCDVPAARQAFYAKPGAVSIWKGAIAGDNAQLASGAVVEFTEIFDKAGGTLAQAQADLQAGWQRRQDDVTNLNPWVRFGTTWDGTTWTSGGVA